MKVVEDGGKEGHWENYLTWESKNVIRVGTVLSNRISQEKRILSNE